MNSDNRYSLKIHICENKWYVLNQPHWRHVSYFLVQEMYVHCIYAKVSLFTKGKESLEPGLVMSHDFTVIAQELHVTKQSDKSIGNRTLRLTIKSLPRFDVPDHSCKLVCLFANRD